MSENDRENLLSETIGILTDSGHSVDDVDWVGSRDGQYAIPWAEFAKIADLEYHSGFGGQVVASDLVIVLNGRQWLERHEYDGAEWWEYESLPKRQPDAKCFCRLFDWQRSPSTVAHGLYTGLLDSLNGEECEEDLP